MPPQNPGHTSMPGCSGSLVSVSLRCTPTGRCHTSRPVARSIAKTIPALPEAITRFRPPARARIGEFCRSWWNISCGCACRCQRLRPARSNASTLLEYRFGPGRLEPFGWPRTPGAGAGLPVDQNVVPVSVSSAGVNHTPAPLLTLRSPQKRGSTVWKSHGAAVVLPDPVDVATRARADEPHLQLALLHADAAARRHPRVDEAAVGGRLLRAGGPRQRRRPHWPSVAHGEGAQPVTAVLGEHLPPADGGAVGAERLLLEAPEPVLPTRGDVERHEI